MGGVDLSSEDWDSDSRGDDDDEGEDEGFSDDSDGEVGDMGGDDPDSCSYEEDPGEPDGGVGNSGIDDPTAILDALGRGLLIGGKAVLDAIDRWVRRRQRRESDAEVRLKDDDEALISSMRSRCPM